MAVQPLIEFDTRQGNTKICWGGVGLFMDPGVGVPINAPEGGQVTLKNGDTGQPAQTGNFAYCSFQLTGTAGAGFSFSWEVSNDGGTTWTAVSAAITTLTVGTVWGGTVAPFDMIRPHITAGDGTTSVSAYLSLLSQRG